MNSSEIVDLMQKSKLYIDFGEFPGPERIPREAVLMGCNIITSTKGSAGANDIDVPIDRTLKIEAIDENINKIVSLIEDIINNYAKYYPMFNEYRRKVIEQPLIFEENINKLCMILINTQKEN